MKSVSTIAALLVASIATAQYRDTRPTRGVWLRPPTTIALLEPELQNFAAAGITDLYLETFYWGLSTGKQGVFNRRFTFDYLDQATTLAARYGIRMHAWIETAYWQYQTTGAYNFTANPEWRAINTSTGTFGGDIVDQVFANLCHPGVQAKMKSYCTELAQYPGLWSIQTDYHRFPLDNSTTDAYTAPWSYDTYSNTAFKAIYGASADITTTARQPGQTNWNNFLTWRRNGITEAANQMKQGVLAGSNDVLFSCAIFAKAMTDSTQLTKCQNWPAWASAGYVDQVMPMAYGAVLSSVQSDVNFAVANASGKPVIPGIAISGTTTHPSLTSQLNMIKGLGIEDFVLWEGNAYDTAQNRIDSASWVATTKKMRADFDDNGTIDKRDWTLFADVYNGIAESGTGRMDMDNNGVINPIDSQKVREQLRKFRFGPNGIVDAKDSTAFNSALAASTTSNSNLSLFNLDGDGDVDAQDADWMSFFGSPAGLVFADIELQDSTLPDNQAYSVQLRNALGTLISTRNLTAKPNGQVVLWVPTTGNYQISVQYGTWLRKSVPVSVAATDVAISLNLVNGDIDGDGEVGPSDFDLVVSQFGGTGSADVDGDGEVGPSDFDIIVANFGAQGDS